MFDTSQDVLYLTVSACIAVFTFFLVWIMYYVAQISRQSNEMITDFRAKMEELDQSVQQIKEKVSVSVDNLAVLSEQVSYIAELVGSVGKKKKRRRKKTSDDE